MSLHSREGSNHTPEERFYPSLDRWTNEFIGVIYGSLVTQKQMLFQNVHPGMSDDSWRLRPWSSLRNEKGTPATVVSFLQQLLLLIKWGRGGCQP